MGRQPQTQAFQAPQAFEKTQENQNQTSQKVQPQQTQRHFLKDGLLSFLGKSEQEQNRRILIYGNQRGGRLTVLKPFVCNNCSFKLVFRVRILTVIADTSYRVNKIGLVITSASLTKIKLRIKTFCGLEYSQAGIFSQFGLSNPLSNSIPNSTKMPLRSCAWPSKVGHIQI